MLGGLSRTCHNSQLAVFDASNSSNLKDLNSNPPLCTYGDVNELRKKLDARIVTNVRVKCHCDRVGNLSLSI